MSVSQLFTSPTYAILSLVSALAIVALGIILHDVLLWFRLPPGPLPLPFIGNKFDIPKAKPWLQFQQWSKKYGPIFTIWIGRKPTLVISDPQVAVDLMEKRSAKYSSRPRMVVMGELYNGNSSILTQPYGKEWSVRRKLLHQALSARALELYKPTQEAEAARLCYALLENPSAWEKELERFTSSVVFCVAYGHRIDSLNACVISDRFRFMHNMASLNVPGKYLAETIPLLAKLPAALAPWKRVIRAMGDEEARANMGLLQMVKNDIATARERGASEALPDSLCKLLLDLRESEPVPLSEKHFSYIPASLFGAGSDTTASTLCSAFLALVTHPHVLDVAQKELHAVVGSGRMPTFADKPDLPYISALCKEVLRWRPVAVLGGTPHASTANDTYGAFFIPSGTTVLSNSWAINLNDEYYPEPDVFDPIRFLTEKELTALGIHKQPYLPVKTHPSRSGHSSFGWGRRICPGADLAFNSLFIALARLLWAYDLLPCEGVTYDTFAYTEGFNIRPEKFECIIRIRSSQYRDIVEKEQALSLQWLDRFAPFEEDVQ
jgi:cytochrome P450